ncbi:MAG: hypothetical protein HQK81_02475 [Desulfovibrionaceae bacterium]|nr:hypothetical protein [Desulfovibrionaceae bacterium]MBF0512911.1 hypothetical protein [Desulfovibrionaceae bacterium]
MPLQMQSIIVALLVTLLSASCVHRAAGPNDSVAVVDGTITIQCYDGHELLVQGQAIYLIPETGAAKEFLKAHDDDFDVDTKEVMALPGAKSAVIDRYGKFSFSNVAQGNYYVYWQIPPEEKKGVRTHVSIDNKVIQVALSRRNSKIVFENIQN